ncbi:MAG TPA: carbon monoxide dehydrogenase subunit G [Rhizomicrobium sp.]
MEFAGRYLIPAAPDFVWAALNNPDVLKASVPGCERLARVAAHRFDAVASLRIGPVKATFKANIEQSDLDPPHRCVLKGEGRGGVAGFARGEAEVLLAPEADGTVLSYTAKATLGGKLAQIGQRLIDGAARQIADDFFARFAAQVAIILPPPEPEEMLAAVETESVSEPATASAERREGVAPEIWVVGLIAVIVILLVLFGVAL